MVNEIHYRVNAPMKVDDAAVLKPSLVVIIDATAVTLRDGARSMATVDIIRT